MKKSILIIDDDKNILQYLTDALEDHGFDVTTCLKGDEGIDLYEDVRPFLVLTDLRMSGIDGLGVIERIKEKDKDARIIMMTGFASVETAVEAMKRGAEDYIVKPFDVGDLLPVMDRFKERDRLDLEKETPQKDMIANVLSEYGLTSEAMKKIFDTVFKVAKTNATVLLTGESGVGKELVAKCIHKFSPRKNKPFVPVDCGAIAESLLESELFGHQKGSFTGANENHIGLFESASGGTLFLEEIGNMTLGLQVKLLRALQEKKIKPVGSVKEKSVDIRVIVATNKNLRWEVDQGTFRKDLYYRLDVISILVPSLRERPEDIKGLTDWFLRYFAEKGYSKKTFSKDTHQKFKTYHWPGNIRELSGVIEQMVTLTNQSEISDEDLPDHIRQPNHGRDFKAEKNRVVTEFEKGFLEEALKRNQGNVSKTARELDISRKSLYQKMKDLDIKAD